MKVAWVLNLDADDELAHSGAHTPTARMTERISTLLPKLEALVRGNDVLWPVLRRTGTATVGQAWCPTRWALSTMQAAGVACPSAPSQEVLRVVNHRQFAHRLGQALPGVRWVASMNELAPVLAQASELESLSSTRQWLLKRPLGYAGRGKRRVSSALVEADHAWVVASFREHGGLLVEPLVDREADFGLHGWLEPNGSLVAGAPTLQHIDSSGAWERSELAPDASLAPAEHVALFNALEATAAGLHRAGYFGPFGIDAFRWRDTARGVHFQPRCEVNARYSMGWATGMQSVRGSIGPHAG